MRCRDFAAALLVLAMSGCSCGPGPTIEFPNLGEKCNPVGLCATGLGCSANGFCEKNCQCESGKTTCTPTNLSEGCPPKAICVVTEATGKGVCQVSPCENGGCPPGEGRCALAPDQTTTICVGDGFPFRGLDAASDLISSDR